MNKTFCDLCGNEMEEFRERAYVRRKIKLSRFRVTPEERQVWLTFEVRAQNEPPGHATSSFHPDVCSRCIADIVNELPKK